MIFDHCYNHGVDDGNDLSGYRHHAFVNVQYHFHILHHHDYEMFMAVCPYKTTPI